jgi:hypothetical protein
MLTARLILLSKPDDLDVLGVDALADSAVQIRVRMKTVPTKQWRIKRALQKYIKEIFDEHDVEIPFPHRKIIHVYENSPEDMNANMPMSADTGETPNSNPNKKSNRSPKPKTSTTPEQGNMADGGDE